MAPRSLSALLLLALALVVATCVQGQCSKDYAGCTGTFVDGGNGHNVGGKVEVVDDCTLKITDWSYDEAGAPAVELYVAKAESADDKTFDYENAKAAVPKDYVVPEGDGSGSFEVKLADGIKVSDEYNHLSVWCVDFTIDFGNAVITCPDQMMG